MAQLSGIRVAILATDGFEQSELTEPRNALNTAGATTELVSSKNGKIRGWNHKEWGQEIEVDQSLDDADPADYDALVLPGGGMIVDAAVKIRELEAQHNISLPEDPSYETVGGYILNALGFIPRGGESFEAGGNRFTVMDVDHRRVSRVKIAPLNPPPGKALGEVDEPPSKGGGTVPPASARALARERRER